MAFTPNARSMSTLSRSPPRVTHTRPRRAFAASATGVMSAVNFTVASSLVIGFCFLIFMVGVPFVVAGLSGPPWHLINSGLPSPGRTGDCSPDRRSSSILSAEPWRRLGSSVSLLPPPPLPPASASALAPPPFARSAQPILAACLLPYQVLCLPRASMSPSAFPVRGACVAPELCCGRPPLPPPPLVFDFQFPLTCTS